MSSTKPLRITELSGWRGIFILMIFFHHVDLLPGGGSIGVAFFFLLGGFAMTLGYSEKVVAPTFNYGKYLWKRVFKFYPIHWVLLFGFCILNYLCSAPLGIKTFIPNFLLLQSFIPNKDFFYSYNSPSWYLCDTLFFVALFPFIIRGIYRLKDSLWLKVLTILLVSAYVAAQIVVPEEQSLAILYINPFARFFDYVAGILASLWLLRWTEKEKQVNRLAMYGLLALSVILIICAFQLDGSVRKHAPVLWIPMLGLLLSTSIISLRGGGISLLRSKPLVSFGEVSFAFYMVHSLVINVVKVAFFKLGISSEIAMVCTALVLSVILSYLATYYFVQPVSLLLNKKLS